MTDERSERGWEKLRELAGADGERVIETVWELSPDLARLVVELRGILAQSATPRGAVSEGQSLGHVR
jgi:hypothetical protein